MRGETETCITENSSWDILFKQLILIITSFVFHRRHKFIQVSVDKRRIWWHNSHFGLTVPVFKTIYCEKLYKNDVSHSAHLSVRSCYFCVKASNSIYRVLTHENILNMLASWDAFRCFRFSLHFCPILIQLDEYLQAVITYSIFLIKQALCAHEVQNLQMKKIQFKLTWNLGCSHLRNNIGSIQFRFSLLF